MPPNLTLVDKPSARFDIFTGILKAAGGDGDPLTLSGVASSTVEDLYGDRIERTALKDMENQVLNGLTIFLNHRYAVPEDVAGHASDSKITKRGTDANGNGVWDLDMEITVNEANPRAVQAWKEISKGAKLGLSIGANIPPGGYEIDDKTGARIIKRVNLLETSIVGIPANPRSWIARALEALDGSEQVLLEGIAPGEVQTTQTPGFVPLVTVSNGKDGFNSTSITWMREADLEVAPPADDREIDVTLTAEVTVEEEAIVEDTSPDQPDTDPDDIKTEAQESDPVPEVQDTSGVDTLESDAAIEAALGSLTTDGEVNETHLQMAVDIARALAGQVERLRGEVDAALAAKAEAERDRDEVVAKTDKILSDAAAIIQTLGDMPLGRKATLQREAAKLKHLEGVYSAEYMQMLEK